MTEQQWRIIRVLADSRSIDFHDLSVKTCILRPSLTGILTRMERDGLIFRLKPLNDQRKLYVSLTPQGQDLYDHARQEVEAGYQSIEQAFSSEKMQQLTQLLDELITLDRVNDQHEIEKIIVHNMCKIEAKKCR